MEPLFLRSAVRNYEKAKAARKKRVENPDDFESLLDEIEFSIVSIISATACLESYIDYVIGKYLPKESKVFDDTSSPRQKWLWVPQALNIPYKFKADEPSFSDFSSLVKWRNNAIHHKANYYRARGSISHTANQFNLENAELTIKVVREMVTKLSDNSPVILPHWITAHNASAGYWDEVSSHLK